MLDFNSIINNIHNSLKNNVVKGVVASYIPVLSKQDVNQFGIFMQHIDGRTFKAGDTETLFSIQTISCISAL